MLIVIIFTLDEIHFEMTHHYHMEAETKWPPFFIKKISNTSSFIKIVVFDSNFTEVCHFTYNLQTANIGSGCDDGLGPKW